MKLRVRDLKTALDALQWKTGWESNNRFDDGTLEISMFEEDLEAGILCGSVKIAVTFDAEEDKTAKQVTKSIEIYPNDESREPVITKTETYKLKAK